MSKKLKGGQKTELLEKARRLLWYWSVRERTSLKDSELDAMFVWRNPLNASSADQPRIFEQIRTKAMGTLGSVDRRSLEEIVVFVNEHPNFLGSAAVFNSMIWKFFELKVVSRAELLERFNDIFLENDIKRYSDKKYPPFSEPKDIQGLRAANLPEITWLYWDVLSYCFSQTISPLQNHNPQPMLEVMLERLENDFRKYFEKFLGDLASQCALTAVERIKKIRVVRIFN
jgi:hypothetical protein